jgi:hypothetical protein
MNGVPELGASARKTVEGRFGVTFKVGLAGSPLGVVCKSAEAAGKGKP